MGPATVRLDALEGHYKFIQAHDRDGKTYLRGTPERGMHHQILMDLGKELQDAGLEARVDCHGGGWLLFDTERKTAQAHRDSGDYGPFDQEVVEPLLRDYLSQHGYALTRCRPGR